MKIISGGQTGVDRAALDAAIEMRATLLERALAWLGHGSPTSLRDRRPAESEAPGIYAKAKTFLQAMLNA
jgi:hypothetical protein